MKKFLSLTLSLALVASFSTSVFASSVDVVTTTTTPAVDADNDYFSIYTNGDVSINVTPDIAYLSLGILTEDTTSTVATEKNAQTTTQVISALEDAGINSSDIQTQYYNIYPTYDYSDNYQKINGYSVSHGLNVTVRDITKIGEILDIAIENGVNTTTGITFDIQDKDQYYTEALLQAVDVAIQKGNAIASSVGVTDPKVMSIAESSVYYQPVTYSADNVGMKADIASPIQSSSVTIYASAAVAMGK